LFRNQRITGRHPDGATVIVGPEHTSPLPGPLVSGFSIDRAKYGNRVKSFLLCLSRQNITLIGVRRKEAKAAKRAKEARSFAPFALFAAFASLDLNRNRKHWYRCLNRRGRGGSRRRTNIVLSSAISAPSAPSAVNCTNLCCTDLD